MSVYISPSGVSPIKVSGTLTTNGSGGISVDANAIGIGTVSIITDPEAISTNVLVVNFSPVLTNANYVVATHTYGDISSFVQYTGYPIKNGRTTSSVTLRYQLGGYGDLAANALHIMISVIVQG